MNRIKSLLLALAVVGGIAGFTIGYAKPASALFEAARDQACAGVELQNGNVKCDKTAGTKVDNLIACQLSLAWLQ
jgi:hypothetical protein